MWSRDQANAFRYDGGEQGHYESYFQRANHPTRPLAFWIRYTIFSPRAWSRDAVAELWAVYFDGERGDITAVKEVVPFAQSSFDKTTLNARIGEATLDDLGLVGSAQTKEHRIAWSLRYDSPEPPLLLLPKRLYKAGFPKAKALVGSPLAMFSGELEVDDKRIDVSAWVGSQNHNWGQKHTDRYAWGQVAGFDEAPDAFFECATASLKMGPIFTPPMTPMVLRYGGEEYRLSALPRALRAKGHYSYFSWYLSSASRNVAIDAEIHGRASDFIALRYGNPPGGDKTCLNTKIASAKLVLRRKGKGTVVLHASRRAAFEILTDDARHGVRMLEV